MNLTYFVRDPRPNNHTFEQLFGYIYDTISKYEEVRKIILPPNSSRINHVLLAKRYNSQMNHITGDVNYLVYGLSNSKNMITIHDVGHYFSLGGIKRIIYGKVWLEMPLDRCRVITTISNFTKFELVRNFGIDPDKVKVIHDPVLPGFNEVAKQNNRKPVILQIGSGGNKNVNNLLEACKGLNVKLILVNKLNPSLEAKLESYKIEYEKRVNLTLEELRATYVESDLLYFASTYEGFGMPITEAQSVGRPVITSNIASMPEVGGNAVHLVDPFNVADIRNGIVKIIEDHSYSSSLVDAGLKNVNRFDVETIAKQYIDSYYQLEKE